MNKLTNARSLYKSAVKQEIKLNDYLSDLCVELLAYFDFDEDYKSELSIVQQNDGFCFCDNDGINVPVHFVINEIEHSDGKIDLETFKGLRI